jgi:predicted ribosomally synthesized peptide with nif11-like leader
MDEMMKKVEELSQNEEFKTRIAQMESVEEVAAAFQAEGVKVTAEDLQTAAAAQQSGELNEGALENVSGGLNILQMNPAYWITKWIVSKAIDSRGICKK